MSRVGGKYSGGLAGSMTIAQSRRWRQFPTVPSAPSDDDRIGGGASLTARSDAGDSGINAVSHPPSAGAETQKPATPVHRLRGNAQSFVSSINDSAGSTGGHTSPTTVDSDSLKSTASQPCIKTHEQAADIGHGKEADANFITASHHIGKHRPRSATTLPIQTTARDYAVGGTKMVQDYGGARDTGKYPSRNGYPPSIASGLEDASDATDPALGNSSLAQGTQRNVHNQYAAADAGHLHGQRHAPSYQSFDYNKQAGHRLNYLTPGQSMPQRQLDHPTQRDRGATTLYPPGYTAQGQTPDSGNSSLAANGRGFQPQTGSGPLASVNGYRHGNTSDGSGAPYHAYGPPEPTMALVPASHQVAKALPTVGPLDLRTPHKSVQIERSELLQALTEAGQPSLSDLFDRQFLPFTEGYKLVPKTEEYGVVVIRNIPYETTRGEVIALLGKASKLPNDRFEPVHIIMDRVTSKTQDAYCELLSLNNAIETVERFKRGAKNGRIGRLGNRIVEVELSSQTNLMRALFPITVYGVEWIGSNPKIITGRQFGWENFKSFFTEEEMVMLSKHIENSSRSLFSKVCPERPYECMISTLRKIPWQMAEHITIKQRHSVYDAAVKMIKILSEKVRPGGTKLHIESTRLTPQLLDRLVTAAMTCPGFSVVQKHNIAIEGGFSEEKCRPLNQPQFPERWVHQWTLVPKPGMPLDVLEWYIAVIRDETTRVVQSLDIPRRMPLENMSQHLDGYWGFFWAEANFPVGPEWDNLSLAECSRREWRAIEQIITRAVQGGAIPPSYTTESNHISSVFTNGHARIAYNMNGY